MDKQLASDIDHAAEGEDLRDSPLDMRGGSRGRQAVQQTTKIIVIQSVPSASAPLSWLQKPNFLVALSRPF